ncbi:hypothetical protein GDO86_016400 [Hymenochirus boettgeri]|uniref:G-protein coupled receptors family 1 profile domain-containing protein n=1 Tax=Hymenochirus boettgeri TaxID=247094 RepID=A0A8T2K2A8_9PIPI|nr:hypothetical protein GDO86_016400 [Hymenochirus boettgeri]
MCGDNETSVTEFILLGFYSYQNLKIVLFIVFLLIYISILTGNLMIILLVTTSPHLKNPMYIFLKHLALADVVFTSNIIPNMLHTIINDGSRMTITACYTQYYFHCFSAFAQSLFLTSMSFDRYIAICHPLRYISVMNPKVCSCFIFWSWATGFILLQIEFISLSNLKFCGSNIIDHFFCDFAPVLSIASSDTFKVLWEDFVITAFLIIVPFVLVIISYISIFITILKLTTADGRRKAFSTCSSHLAILCLYYGTIITIYLFPVGQNTPHENKLKSLLYTTLTPFLNPILYSMRNQEIRRSLHHLFCKLYRNFRFNSFYIK